MATYRPRWVARLTLPDPDEQHPVQYDALVRRARFVRNDHNRADECTITLDWRDGGADPRILASGIVFFYMGDATASGEWTPDETNLRFVGRVSRVRRSAGEGEPHSIELECLDYTSFFLVAKPVATEALPRFSDTLAEAWARLCTYSTEDGPDRDGTPPIAEKLADAIVFRGDALAAPGPVIGKSVADRFRQLGNVHSNPDADAWAIWQQAVGALGLITFFENDYVVVTTAEDYYTADAPPTLVWGQNVLRFEEERHNNLDRIGVGISSFNPLTGRAIEALWPPVGDKMLKKKGTGPGKGTTRFSKGKGAPKKAGRKAKAGAPDVTGESKRKWFSVYDVTDPDVLLDVAKRVYEEAVRQEFTGTITTKEMAVEADDGSLFDLLALRSGDTIKLRLDDIDEGLKGLGTTRPSRTSILMYLLAKGYTEEFAEVIVNQWAKLGAVRSEFYVRTVTVEAESTPEGGSFQVEIEYLNKIT